ncbi:hypothetical protein LXL04_027052 [Taraxacum kok-saghyz]
MVVDGSDTGTPSAFHQELRSERSAIALETKSFVDSVIYAKSRCYRLVKSNVMDEIESRFSSKCHSQNKLKEAQHSLVLLLTSSVPSTATEEVDATCFGIVE